MGLIFGLDLYPHRAGAAVRDRALHHRRRDLRGLPVGGRDVPRPADGAAADPDTHPCALVPPTQAVVVRTSAVWSSIQSTSSSIPSPGPVGRCTMPSASGFMGLPFTPQRKMAWSISMNSPFEADAADVRGSRCRAAESPWCGSRGRCRTAPRRPSLCAGPVMPAFE